MTRRMHKTLVINAVGLTPSLIGEHTPHLRAFRDAGMLRPIGHVLPALTTTVQSTYLTGAWPSEHGIVGNGWYFRDECEVRFWRQSNALVQGQKLWDKARAIDSTFTCANLFWWYAMYAGTDVTVTPRPMYPADGRKLPDIYTQPADLRFELQRDLGQFPLFHFWGPATSIASSRWIAEAAIRVDRRFNPTLTLVYLPHLDYVMQREGPTGPSVRVDLGQLDDVCGRLFDHFRKSRIIVLSEYGIAPVSRPVHLNRALRQAGLLAIREELGLELLDAGASEAFAVADHQVAHLYVRDPAKANRVRELIERVPGVARVLDDAGKREHHLDHPRSGELVALAEPGSWFTFYYWLDDAVAPDFARTVDIHRKPGYDPAELFVDPALTLPKLRIAWTLLKKKLGFRYLMKVIPLDAGLVKGSHGIAPLSPEEGPMLMSNHAAPGEEGAIAATDVQEFILRSMTR